MRTIMAALAAIALTASVANGFAQTPAAEGESVLTLRVDGELSIDAEGRVLDYRIDTRLDPQVEKLVRRAVPGWRFKPILIDGQPIIAKSPMRITLAAIEREQGYQVKVDNVVFRPNTREEYEAEQAALKAHPRMSVEGETPGPRVWIRSKSLRPPKYPPDMLQAGVEGIVLLNGRVNPDGTVAEVFAGQSSLLNIKGDAGALDRARAILERNASATAKRWTFDVATEDSRPLSAAALTVRVPVEYLLASPGAAPGSIAGKWRHEFRGPNRQAPWLQGENAPKIGVSDLNGSEILAGVSPFGLRDDSVIGTTL